MINFAIDGLTEEIDSDRICFENHHAKNLVSKNQLDRQKGFLADYFVKPPVSVSFKFSCKIDIKYVLVNVRVGSQESEKFELHTNSSLGLRKVIECTSSENGVVSCHIYGNEPLPDERNLQCTPFSFFSPRNLKDVDRLIIKIVKTRGSSVPALGFVEIWGFPSKLAKTEDVTSINTAWNAYRASLLSRNRLEASLEHGMSNPKAILSIIKKDVKIPDEFIDPITFDIMLLPMVLPCGKTVDKRTLEKCSQTDVECGRPATDPFSGVILTSQNQPVVDVALKARIDHFLVKNSEREDLKNIPRIICRTPGSSAPLSDVRQSHCPKRSNTEQTKCDMATESSSSKRTKLTADQIINQCLSSMPSYLEKSIIKIDKKECIFCQSIQQLFQLPCKHLLCRNCLKMEHNRSCKSCSRTFIPSDAIRYHVS